MLKGFCRCILYPIIKAFIKHSIITEVNDIPMVLQFKRILIIWGALTIKEPYTKAYPTNFDKVYMKRNIPTLNIGNGRSFFD